MNWQKIVIHHSASPTEVHLGGKTVPVNAGIIRLWHLTKGWNDIGYHFVILPDGRCEDGRPLYKPGAHCKASNRNFIGIGICLVGDFSKNDVPDAQLEGLINKVEQLIKVFNLSIDDVEFHREVNGAATECPGRNFPGNIFIERLRNKFA